MKKILATGAAALGILGGSVAVAALNPFSAASAQGNGTVTLIPTQEQSPPTTAPTTPANPTNPAPGQHNCPNMGGSNGNDSQNDNSNTTVPTPSSATNVALYRHRGRM
jgi:hypothetical protein